MSPDAPYLHWLDGLTFRPVFVVGMHRSGTTLLYRMLAKSGAFNITSLFHIVNRDRLLRLHVHPEEAETKRRELATYLDVARIQTRDYDSMPVGCDESEEYAFALDHQGRWPLLNERNSSGFLTFARKLQFIQDSSKPLLLKSPYDVVNFRYLSELFPNACFIFIHRNPVEVINSQYRMYRNVFDKQNAYEALVSKGLRDLYNSPLKLALTRLAFSDGLEVLYFLVCRRAIQACRYLMSNFDRLSCTTLTLTYPELCENPGAAVHRALLCAGVSAQTVPVYESMIYIRQPVFHRLVLKHMRWIEKLTDPYRRRFGV